MSAKTKASKPSKAAAKPKSTAAKVTTKTKTSTKKKVLVDINDNGEDSPMDVDDNNDAPDDDPVLSSRNENQAMPAKKKTASETYTKVRQVLVSDLLC